MPFSASPKPAPSSASPSGIISAPGWAASIPAPSPTSRNSSACRFHALNRPDFCPYYSPMPQLLEMVVLSDRHLWREGYDKAETVELVRAYSSIEDAAVRQRFRDLV